MLEEGEKKKAKKPLPERPEDYSTRSPVAKLYRSGEIPFDHARLLRAIRAEIKKKYGEEATEGEINLKNILEKTGYFRPSALNMLHHMRVFGVLESQPRYNATWVRILNDHGV